MRQHAQQQHLRWLLVPVLLALTSNVKALGESDRMHLLDRVSFGAQAHATESFEQLDREQAVSMILDALDTTIDVPPPGSLSFELRSVPKNLPFTSDALRKFRNARNKAKRAQRAELKQWWLEQIASGKSPVAERLVLFWHNYFATQIDLLPANTLILDQHLTIRQHAVGNYRDLLKAMHQNPALLTYLDNHLNTKQKPNENYARELLELYTLGEGHYTEADIRELARVMTGAGLDRRTWLYRFNKKKHDTGKKTFLGRSGRYTPDDVVDILLEHARAAEYLVERLWKEFVSPEPDPAAVTSLAAVFRNADYDLKPLLQALFEHPAFWDESNRLSLVKSPIEMMVSTHLAADRPIEDFSAAVKALTDMGQDLFNPPDVGGWPAGERWINSIRIARRHQYILDVAGKPTLLNTRNPHLK